MIDMTKKYQTRDGRAVRILATDMKGSDASIIGLVTNKNGTEYPQCWRANGSSMELGVYDSPEDLIPVPTKHEGWTLVNYLEQPFDGDIYMEEKYAQDEALHYGSGVHVAHITWVSDGR